jgi:hypothetical protein
MLGLEASATALLDSGLQLDALPLICAWEHAARHAARRADATALARAARARALCALGLLGEAAEVVAGLMGGEDLPDGALPWPRAAAAAPDEQQAGGGKAGGAAHKVAPAGKGPQQPAGADSVAARRPPAFDAASWPGSPANVKCAEFIAAGGAALPAAVAATYGPWAAAAVERARAAWLMAAGAARNHWRTCNPLTGQRAAPAPAPAPAPGKAPPAAAAAAAAAPPGAPQSSGPVPPHECKAVEDGLLDAASTLLRASAAQAARALQESLAPAVAAGDAAGASAGGAQPGSARRPGSAGRVAGGGASTVGRQGGADGGATEPPTARGGPATARSGSTLAATARGEQHAGARLEGPDTEAAAHCHAAALALLQLSEAEALRWMPAAGLDAALEAARLIGQHGGAASAGLAAASGEDAARLAMGPHLWLRVRLQARRGPWKHPTAKPLPSCCLWGSNALKCTVQFAGLVQPWAAAGRPPARRRWRGSCSSSGTTRPPPPRPHPRSPPARPPGRSSRPPTCSASRRAPTPRSARRGRRTSRARRRRMRTRR